MRYILLLRGINVGGNHKVQMSELKKQLAGIGFSEIISYINSGNLLLDSDEPLDTVKRKIRDMLKDAYPFEIPIVLIPADQYLQEFQQLPGWWKEEMARKDVIFYTDEIIAEDVIESIANMPLTNEIIHFGRLAVFWGKYDEKEYLKTAYSKLLIKQPYYRNITIRNGNTFNKIVALLLESKSDGKS